MQKSVRMKKELKMLTESPPHGISCWSNGSLDKLEAIILGGEDTPYSGGVFKLEIQIPDRYPFEPPKVRFLTPIYHPNIDTGGRICLDTLKMPPKGAWKPCLNIGTVLTSIQLLMAEPNPDDPLMTDISSEFKHNRAVYEVNAKQWTEKHAKQESEDYSDDKEEENKEKNDAKGDKNEPNNEAKGDKSEPKNAANGDKSELKKDLSENKTRHESLGLKRNVPMLDRTNKQPKLK